MNNNHTFWEKVQQNALEKFMSTQLFFFLYKKKWKRETNVLKQHIMRILVNGACTLKHWKTTIYNITTKFTIQKKTIMKTQMTIVNENICAVYDNKQPITVKHQEI